jgi:hypothetical protein
MAKLWGIWEGGDYVEKQRSKSISMRAQDA